MCGSLHQASTSASTHDFISVLRASKQRVVGFEDQNLHKVTTMACRAVIEAASRFNRFFSGQMTAAGRVPPAKVRLQPWNTYIPLVAQIQCTKSPYIEDVSQQITSIVPLQEPTVWWLQCRFW